MDISMDISMDIPMDIHEKNLWIWMWIWMGNFISTASLLIAHYDNTPFWIPAGTNKDDLE